MPDTPQPSPASTPNPAPASQPQGGSPSAPPVQNQAPAKYALPTELRGKTAEEVGEYYNTRLDGYKDYDSIKERATKYGDYEGLKLTPEQIRANVEWTRQVAGNLQRGLQAVYNPQTNQVEWVETGKPQPQAQPTVEPQQQQDWRGQDWDVADETVRADRMAGHVWRDLLTPEITKVVNRYNEQFAQAVQGLDQKFSLFMDAVEQWQANPTKLKLREIIANANQMMQSRPADYIRQAAQAQLSPEQMEMDIQNRVAAAIAEFKTQWENEHKAAAPIMPSPLGGSHRPVAQDGKPRTLAEAREGMFRTLHRLNNGGAR